MKAKLETITVCQGLKHAMQIPAFKLHSSSCNLFPPSTSGPRLGSCVDTCHVDIFKYCLTTSLITSIHPAPIHRHQTI